MGNELAKVGDVEVIGPGALAQISTADTLAQVEVARGHRREVSRFTDDTLTIACLNESTAAACFYRLPRAGETIDGPSIRLAEIIATTYGNLRVSAHVAEIGKAEVIAVGTCLDLESNTAFQTECRRRITKRNGQRYGADMIEKTANAAVSIAMRNAIFRVVPRPLVDTMLEQIKQAATGKGTTEQKRARAFQTFRKDGVEEADVLRLVKARRAEDVGIDEIITLRGYYSAIREGEATVESLLAEIEAKPKPRRQDPSERRSTLFDEPEAPSLPEPTQDDEPRDPRDEDAP
ncbi:MAG: hypothetical protein AAF721_00265 [Myxococcota bacterium]